MSAACLKSSLLSLLLLSVAVAMISTAVPPQLREPPPVLTQATPHEEAPLLLLDASMVSIESYAAEARSQISSDPDTSSTDSLSNENEPAVFDDESSVPDEEASTSFATVAEHVAAIEQKLRLRGVSRTDRRALRMRLDQLRKDAALQAQQMAMLEKARRMREEDERLMREEAEELARKEVRA